MLKIKDFDNAMKWGYPAFPFYTSVYFLLANEPKRKYFTKWIFLCIYKDNQLLGYNSRIISEMGEKIIKELLAGNDGYYKELTKVLDEIHRATEICLKAKENNKIRDLNYWWKAGQSAFSNGANLIFGFDNALNEYIDNLKINDPDLYNRLKSNIVEAKESFMTEALNDLRGLVKKYPNNFSKAYVKFIEKYYWLQNSYLGKFDITQDWLREYYDDNKNKLAGKEKNKILPLNSNLKLLAKASKLAITFRDDRKKMFLVLIDLMDEWLHLICEDNGWEYDDMKWLSMGEVILCLNGDKKLLKRAKKYSATKVRIGLMGGIGLTDINQKMFDKIKKLNSPKDNLKEFKGSIGNKGKVRGIARIILDVNRDGRNLKSGEILVTSMTRPEFLPLMSRASAFITDEGGITCHAGIVAREMNKPCIVGTKIATKVLHDGDLIEIDADKGIVKIIK